MRGLEGTQEEMRRTADNALQRRARWQASGCEPSTGRRLIIGLACMTLMAFSASYGSAGDNYKAGAFSGDYQAQRNYAYSLANGEGVPKDDVEACAWRMIIISTQGAKVMDGDLLNLRAECKTVGTRAAARARALTSSLPPVRRTLLGDIADLTDNACPGPRCSGPLAALAGDYASATTGDVQAARRASDCLAGGCEMRAFNLFYACLMARLALTAQSASGSSEARVRERQTCGILDASAEPSIEEHLQQLRSIGRN